ncbi:glycosyltransferase [Paenibacillus lentus]|uniref:Glycosyltransferase n=1 Tax=Paenibacillus lentus TaxID=1338368 RepID=A0A3Q8S5P9_9BACL|nr:glycosyltransferase [Paenibacillus lentus]AZK47590.1 glycosyltransferase [Paenibacillus lentus]
MLNSVIPWSKGKRKAHFQKRALLRRIKYWEATKNKRIRAKQNQSAINSPASTLPSQSTEVISGNQREIQIAEPIQAQSTVHQEPLIDAATADFQVEPRISPLDPKNIVLFRFPIIDWNYRWQRPQHISQQFARHGYRVFYFSIETMPISNPDASFLDIQSALQIQEAEKNVWLVKLCSHNSLNAYRDKINHPLDKQYMKWSIDALKQKFNIAKTASIVDLPFWSMLVFDLEDNKVIYDCMDEHAGFSNTSEELLALEPALMNRADAVVASSDVLYQKARKLNPSAHLIRNAGEFEYFSVTPNYTPIDITNVKKPIIGYIGAIADWFDMELVYELARDHPEWNFVLVGDTYYSDTSKLETLNNVYLFGEKVYHELPAYLHAFDVCLIPFLIKPLTLATNPVKVYEYLAAGKPVVSTPLPELASMEQYVSLANGVKEFEAAIVSALQEKDQGQSSIIEERRQFAAENTWEHRYKEFHAIIFTMLYPKISIIIVTHNNWEFTERCLNSLLQHTVYPRLEVIFVDNASTDETPQHLLKLTDPHVKTILLSENEGFAAGNNIGMLNATGDYVVLLNNDTILSKEWLPRLLRPFKMDAQIAAVGPMSNFVGNDQKLDFFVGDEVKGANEAWLDQYYELHDKRVRYSEMLGFFCVAIKKSVTQEIGPIDKQFGLGMFEDDDYCLRLRIAGYRLAVAEDAFVYHQGSATFNKWDEEQRESLFLRNKAYFESKWQRAWTPHKLPQSLFLNITDPDTIAEIAAASNQTTVFASCPDEWNNPKKEWQINLLQICNGERLVIARVRNYLGQKIDGIRKIGPNLYFTNNELLLQKIKFKYIYDFTQIEHGGELIGDEPRLLTSV